ncbi:hypothetical protein B566_EDAN012262 [Ephemera danica]|nr:hypothetical protein B566_EDAN012262 [Ephemera danica]
MDVQLQRHPPPPSSGPTTSATATAAAPFQYFLHEQARSLVALQARVRAWKQVASGRYKLPVSLWCRLNGAIASDFAFCYVQRSVELQHEVGALLEFRELVMDTFPNLRSKLHTTPACTSPAQAPPAGWGPGVRVRRKLGKERERCVDLAADDSSAEGSSKPAGSKSQQQQQPKSSEGASSTSGSTVQDSGFSTETKEHLSSVLSPKLAPSTCAPAASNAASPPTESMDELWNLLDVEELHTKLQRDTQERQQQQVQLQQVGACRRLRVRGGGGEARADVGPDEWLADSEAARAADVQPDDDWTPDVQRLRHERDVLLDKVTEMEAETLQSRARVSQLQAELRQVAGIRRELEAQLSAAVRSRLQHARSEPPTPVERASCFQPVARSVSSPSPRRVHLATDELRPPTRLQNRESRIPRLLEQQQPMQALGRLDGVLSDPALALQVQLQTASSSKGDLAGELERKSIELEGTRARVRVLEKHQQRLQGKQPEPVKVSEEALLNSSSTESAHDGSSPVRSIQQTADKAPEPPKRHHSRSTTIKGKKPSRIPLPPPKAFSAPSKAAPSPAQHARASTLGRKSNSESPASSLQNTKSNRDSISSRSNKESLKVAAAGKETTSKLFPTRKNATSSRPTSSPSSRHKTAGVLELDATKVTASAMPMVQVALEPSFPVDSLNEFPAMCDAELTPWRSSPSEYFDSMNSCGLVPPPPEQLWQRHSDVTASHSLLRPQPPDSLDVAWTCPREVEPPPPTNTDTSKNAPTGLWRVSEHIETILRQISRQTKCDFNN